MDTSAPRCLIPARGGSKGVHRKNLQEVGGIPLVARSIRAALASGVMETITVSTDDSDIADLSRREGAEVLMRPSELASDEASSESVLLHYLHEAGLDHGYVILVQPTTPFLLGSDLRALAGLRSRFDTALTVSPSHVFLWRETSDGSLHGVNHDSAQRLRRQDLGYSEFAENGGAYLISIGDFLARKHRFFGRIGCVVMPNERSIEIDTEADLKLARALFDGGIENN